MGRTRKNKNKNVKKGGQVQCEEPNYTIMQSHLYADMKHDHGAGFYTSLPAAITLIDDTSKINDIVKTIDTSENGMYNQILATYPAENKDARKANIVRFKLDDATSLFPAKDIFKPFANIENIQVGVLQDAGFHLYKVIGATNLITFGSILDQAGKPKEEAFYYKVPDGTTLDIPGCMVGFNKERVGPIRISNFKGNSVVCKFQYKYQDNGYVIGGTSDSGLKLNSIDGDFQSNATVKSADKEIKFKLAIGKALGDALQVMSIMPNPFLMLGNPASSLDGTLPDRIILKSIMNTGDKLNHARAYAFGVGSVYSPPSKSGIRECEYIPGSDSEITPSAMLELYVTRIRELIVKSDLAYEQLSAHLFDLSKSFNQNSSLKSGQPLVTDGKGIITIQNFLKSVSYIVTAIRTYIMAYFKSSVEKFITLTPETFTPDILFELKTVYEKLLKESNGLLPSHTSTLKQKGGNPDVIESMTLCKFSGVLPFSDTPLTVANKSAIDTFMNTIRPSRQTLALPNVSIVGGIKGTFVFYISNIYQLVGKNRPIKSPFSKIFEIIKFEHGPAASEILNPEGSVDGARQIGDIFGQQFIQTTSLSSTGGKMIGGQEGIDDIPNDALQLFKQYAENQGQPNWNNLLTNAFATYVKNPFSIIDETLFAQLYGATIAYYGEPAETAFNGMATAVQTLVLMKKAPPTMVTRSVAAKIKAEEYERYNIHTYASLFFNEFSMWYNSTIVGDIGIDADNDYYQVLMEYYKEFKILREGADNIIYFFENPVAGGQRVERAKFSIDETKSFVKTGGYPSSKVK